MTVCLYTRMESLSSQRSAKQHLKHIVQNICIIVKAKLDLFYQLVELDCRMFNGHNMETIIIVVQHLIHD